MELEIMNEETTGNQQKLPPVVGVDLGGTQIRTAAMRGAKLFSRVSLLTGEKPHPRTHYSTYFHSYTAGTRRSAHRSRPNRGHRCCYPRTREQSHRRYLLAA